jgi:hypothetical protein
MSSKAPERARGSGEKVEQPRATIELVDQHSRPVHPDGPAGSVQEADAILPAELLGKLWRPSYLERLAHAYWRYLRRISFGLLRIIYEPGSRSIVLLHPRLTLLRFRRPQYDTGRGFGQVTWPIERGLLVSSPGRGHLRITVRRLERAEGDPEGCERVRIRSEVENFYPFLRGRGWFARIGAKIYAATQLRIHVLITNGFLRSLAKLDLPPSRVGALAEEDEEGEVPL